MQSFLTDRTQQVAYGGQLSPVHQLLFGVPQGSVLGPLLYVLYTAELGCIVQLHEMKLHQYADDSQVYMSITVCNTAAAVQTFTACIADMNAWMSASRLRLNPAKTQVMCLGSRQLVSQIDIRDIPVLSTHVPPVESAHDLLVVVDSQLSLSAHVTALCYMRSCYYHLRQLCPAARSLSTETAKTLVQGFISCRLDYCNSLLYGVADSLIQMVHSVQNAAARLVTGVRRQEHITPMLCNLHWLPVRERVRFKLACVMYKSLLGQPSPSTWPMMSSSMMMYSRWHLLRSANYRTCVVPRTQNGFGDRDFSVTGPRIWNDLPPELRHVDISFGQFINMLKSYLFRF